VRFGVSGGTVYSNQVSHIVSIGTSVTYDGAVVDTFIVNNPGQSHTGLAVGAFADVSISRRLSIRPVASYIQKGSMQFSGKLVNGTAYSWERADYISVASLIGVRTAPDFFSAVLLAGPRLDFLVHHSNSFFEFFPDDSYNSVIFGLSVCVDFALVRLRRVYVAADLSYDWDLTDAANFSEKSWDGLLNSHSDVRNRAFKLAITLGTPALR
jgi:hypothetical protein